MASKDSRQDGNEVLAKQLTEQLKEDADLLRASIDRLTESLTRFLESQSPSAPAAREGVPQVGPAGFEQDIQVANVPDIPPPKAAAEPVVVKVDPVDAVDVGVPDPPRPSTTTVAEPQEAMPPATIIFDNIPVPTPPSTTQPPSPPQVEAAVTSTDVGIPTVPMPGERNEREVEASQPPNVSAIPPVPVPPTFVGVEGEGVDQPERLPQGPAPQPQAAPPDSLRPPLFTTEDASPVSPPPPPSPPETPLPPQIVFENNAGAFRIDIPDVPEVEMEKPLVREFEFEDVGSDAMDMLQEYMSMQSEWTQEMTEMMDAVMGGMKSATDRLRQMAVRLMVERDSYASEVTD